MRSYTEITPEWKKEHEIVFWGNESMTMKESLGTAIEAMLDGADVDRVEDLPATIEVTAYHRIKPSIIGLDILEFIFDHLDPKLGDPEGCMNDEPTLDMVAAADALASVVNNQYESWICEAVETFLVDVPAWIKAHRPDWLEAKTP